MKIWWKLTAELEVDEGEDEEDDCSTDDTLVRSSSHAGVPLKSAIDIGWAKISSQMSLLTQWSVSSEVVEHMVNVVKSIIKLTSRTLLFSYAN